MTRRLGRANAVRGCPGWHFGLLIRKYDGTMLFEVIGPEGQVIDGLHASRYRTTTMARRMGEKELRGYEHVAQLAIRAARGSS